MAGIKMFNLSGAAIALVSAMLAAPLGAETRVIHAGGVLDVEGGEVLPASIIRVEDGVIVAITPVQTEAPPQDAIDLSDMVVLPGLIDAHTHLCDETHRGDAWDPWSLSAPAVGIICVANARLVLEAGFTTVRNMSEPWYAGLAIRDAAASGRAIGPRIFASGPMIAMTGGHGDWGNWMGPQHHDSTPAEAVADGVDGVRVQTRHHLKHGVDWIKVAATGGFSSHGTVPGAAAYTVEEMRAAVDEAGKRGLFVAAHAHGAAGIRNAVLAGARSIEHGSLLDDAAIDLMKAHEVFLVADLFGAYYDLLETDQDWREKGLSDNRAEYEAYVQRIASAHAAGVRIAFGTDAGATPHGRGAEQFALLVEAGLSPIDAIRAATVVNAELLGISSELGSIAVGKQADLIAVPGNPLTDISTLSSVRFVMRSGRVHVGPGDGANR